MSVTVEYTGCPKKMSPYTNYSSFVKRALLYTSYIPSPYTREFKIVSKPNSNTKMSNYKLITNSSKNALEWFNWQHSSEYLS